MQIDAREIDQQDLLLRLKDELSSRHGCDNVQIDVMVRLEVDVKRIIAFVSMSGCMAEIDKKDNYYLIHVRGIPCCT